MVCWSGAGVHAWQGHRPQGFKGTEYSVQKLGWQLGEGHPQMCAVHHWLWPVTSTHAYESPSLLRMLRHSWWVPSIHYRPVHTAETWELQPCGNFDVIIYCQEAQCEAIVMEMYLANAWLLNIQTAFFSTDLRRDSENHREQTSCDCAHEQGAYNVTSDEA